MASELRVDKIIPVDGAPSSGGGGIVQIVKGGSNSRLDRGNNTGTYYNTYVNATITPKFNTSKILIQTTQVSDNSAGGRQLYLTIQRSIGGASYSNIIGGSEGGYSASYDAGDRCIETANITFLDSPSTTSAVTYKVYGKNSGSGDSTAVGGQNTEQIMVLMEVSA